MCCIIQILLWIMQNISEEFTKYFNLKASGLWQILRTSSLSIYYREMFILKFMLSTCTGGTFELCRPSFHRTGSGINNGCYYLTMPWSKWTRRNRRDIDRSETKLLFTDGVFKCLLLKQTKKENNKTYEGCW